MARALVSKHTPLELVHLASIPMWKPEAVLLDQSGFPWKIHDNYEVDGYWAMLKPMRKRPTITIISTLIPFEEGLAQAYLNRIFDYMSRVESLDLEIRRIRSGTWFQEWVANDWVTDPNHNFNHDVDESPIDTVTITDSRGMSWGPLNCNPMVAPDEWPFRGNSGIGITYTPISNHKEAWNIKLGNLMFDVYNTQDLIMWVEHLSLYGWFETIQKLCPKGMVLSHPEQGVPSAVDEDYCSEDDGMDDGG